MASKPAGRLGDKARCAQDTHGCPACPHDVTGNAIIGSFDVMINGLPALRVGDMGIHVACCGSNTWTAAQGTPIVLIDKRFAHRKFDQTTHCGGTGALIEGSDNVLFGDVSLPDNDAVKRYIATVENH
jgi:uncharacterized Zn-binding protein involved in type VI secretion